MSTLWSTFRDYINSKEIGEEVTRREIIDHIRVTMSHLGFSDVTIDCYRNMSGRLGYLGKGNRLGLYIVRKHYPEGYSSSDLRSSYDLINLTF